MKYILVFMIAVGMYSCKQEYPLEVDMSGTENAYLIVNNSADVTVSESKVFNLYLRTFIPLWEDVTVNWTISGDNFDAFSGSGVFKASTGEKGTYGDTIFIELPKTVLKGTDLSAEGTLTFTCTTSSGKKIDAGYNGTDGDLGVTINKYIPLDRSIFTGLYTEDDGYGPYSDVLVEESPDNEFGLIIHTKTWDDGTNPASYIVTFNTVSGEVNVASQFIGYDYFNGASTDATADGAVYLNPASDGSTGTFNLSTGYFEVSAETALPNYPYSFGDGTITYVKQ